MTAEVIASQTFWGSSRRLSSQSAIDAIGPATAQAAWVSAGRMSRAVGATMFKVDDRVRFCPGVTAAYGASDRPDWRGVTGRVGVTTRKCSERPVCANNATHAASSEGFRAAA